MSIDPQTIPYSISWQGQGALSGFLIGAGMLAWYPDPYRFAHKNTVVPKALNLSYLVRGLTAPVMWSTAVCGVFSLTECLMEQLRDEAKESTHWNAAVAGAAAGLVMGSMSKRVDIMATSSLCLGLTMAMVEFNGQTYLSDPMKTKIKWMSNPIPDEQESETLKGLKEKYPEFKHL
jgi:hypothetical protein